MLAACVATTYNPFCYATRQATRNDYDDITVTWLGYYYSQVGDG